MNKYLVAVDPNNGYSELDNVGVVCANTEAEAKDVFKSLTRKNYSNRNLIVKNIEEITDAGWVLFM